MSADRYKTWEDAVRWLIGQPDQAELVKACYFDAPLAQAAARYFHSTEWKAVREQLPSTPGCVLDLGAGNGITSYALAKSGWHVTALEPDPSPLVGANAIRRLATETDTDIEVVEDFAEQIPFPERSFDLVFGRQVLHHAKSLHVLCKEAHRVLKPGGLFLVLREHVISKRSDLQAFFDKHPLHKYYGGENAYTLREYKRALAGAGLRIDQVFRPMASPMNLAPLTPARIEEMIIERLAPLPASVRTTIGELLTRPQIFWRIGSLLALVDHRPGRLHSFVCSRPVIQ